MAWNIHEAKQGQYDFSGKNDLEGFIRMAQAAGLLVIVRAGQLFFTIFLETIFFLLLHRILANFTISFNPQNSHSNLL